MHLPSAHRQHDIISTISNSASLAWPDVSTALTNEPPPLGEYIYPDAETWKWKFGKRQEKEQLRLNAAWRSPNHSSEIYLMGFLLKLP